MFRLLVACCLLAAGLVDGLKTLTPTNNSTGNGSGNDTWELAEPYGTPAGLQYCMAPLAYAAAMNTDPAHNGPLGPTRLGLLCLDPFGDQVLKSWASPHIIYMVEQFVTASPRVAKVFKQLNTSPEKMAQQARLFVAADQLLAHGRPVNWENIQDQWETEHSPAPFFYIPSLKMSPIVDHSFFPWIEDFQAHTPTIKEEMLAIARSGDGAFGHYNVPEDRYETKSPGWHTFHFVNQEGGVIKENLRKAPRTWEAVQTIPRVVLNNMLMFSGLQPASEVTPHVGWTNIVDRVHLPLVVNGESFLQVANEFRRWKEGRVLVFNDAYVHRIWNVGKSTRVVLFLDVWHHDIGDEDLAVMKPIYDASRETDEFKAGQIMATKAEYITAIKEQGNHWFKE